MSDAPMSAEQVLAMACVLAGEHVTGITSSGPTTKRHRGSGAFLRAVEEIDGPSVAFAREWALGSGMAEAVAAADAPERVAIVLPDGQVARPEASALNAAALLAAEATCAAEVAVLLGILRKRVQRLAALERLRDAVAQVEALGGDSAA